MSSFQRPTHFQTQRQKYVRRQSPSRPKPGLSGQAGAGTSLTTTEFKVVTTRFFSMLHLYDSSPYSIKSQTIRLKAASAVSAAHIKSLVWGEDALAFVYFVPADLSALHLVVADQDVHVASTTLTDSLPYEVFTGIDKNFNEFIGFYPDQPKIFPSVPPTDNSP